jgi:hypothetical protein
MQNDLLSLIFEKKKVQNTNMMAMILGQYSNEILK